jgi:hypothetical protein
MDSQKLYDLALKHEEANKIKNGIYLFSFSAFKNSQFSASN